MQQSEFHSLPNIRAGSAGSELEMQRLFSLSHTQLRKAAETTEYHHKPSPFYIRWIHGYNAKVDAINLNNRGSTNIFYAASNCAVMYNWTTNQMRILQGHRHMVTNIAADAQGKWLVTADSGPENCIIIWDSADYFPQRTLFCPHGETKLAKVAFSSDAKYLLTLGYSKDEVSLYWWIWSYGLDEPHAKASLELFRDPVITMGFNPYHSDQFIIMTKNDIVVGKSGKIFVVERGIVKETDNYELKIRKVERGSNLEPGRFTCYSFVKETSQILVATSKGNIIIYGYNIEFQAEVEPSDLDNLRYIKMFKLEKSRINVIKSIDGVIVTGNNAGQMHFYDQQMKLLYWLHGFQPDCVRSLSFNIAPRSYKIFDPKCGKPCPCFEQVVLYKDPETGMMRQKLLLKQLPTAATIEAKPVIVRDFIVSTRNEGIGFADFLSEKLHKILDNTVATALTMSVHPEKPFVSLGFSDGRVELFNFVQHKLFTRLNLREFYKIIIPPNEESINCNYEVTIPDLSVTCLKYSPSGLHLACGLNTGELLFLDPTTITILTKTPMRDTKYSIQLMTYSCDSLTLALADEGKTVCVYKYSCDNFTWNFIGKHRAHYKRITTINFLPFKNDGEYKLISLGADRAMVEYDIANSSEEYLEIFSLDRVDQSAVPLGAIPWPNPKDLDPEQHRTDLELMLVANDEFKYKLINCKTTMTMATVLGPRYEHPVRRVQLVTRQEAGQELKYLLFATKNVVGLQKMPLDGNPWKHVGLLAHPLSVLDMCYREDSGTLFTIGAKDSVMFQWAANYNSVETTTKNGGADLDPYYCLIENGRPGWLFQEIRDLFYYIQIVCQGTFSPAMRRVKDFIPIDSLPDMMRALGFFPSEYEVENLIVEARFKTYLQKPCSEIDFEEFVKLYLNHRPAFEINFLQILAAFRNFATYRKESYMMYRQDFVDMLKENGERFSQELAWYLLSILSGQTFDDRAAMTEDDFSFLPKEITFSYLLTDIMGLQDFGELSDQISAMGSSVGASSYSHTNSSESIGDKNHF